MITANNKGNGGSNIPLLDSGIYLGTCRMLIDLGTQENEWKNEVKHQHQIFVQFEVHGETIEIEKDDKKETVPRSIGKFYTLSLGDKANLRRDLESWRGKPFTDAELGAFDIEKLLGAPAQLQVVKKKKQNGDEKNDISNIMAVMKGIEIPKLELDLVKYSLEDGDQLTDAVPEGIQAIVKKSPEWQALNCESSVSQEDLDRADAAMDAAIESDIAAVELLDEPPF